MVAEVGLIRIASEARFASFDQSIAGVWRKTLSSVSLGHNDSVGFSCLRFEVFLMFPEGSSSNQEENSEG